MNTMVGKRGQRRGREKKSKKSASVQCHEKKVDERIQKAVEKQKPVKKGKGV